MFDNIPQVKLGLVAVSRDCFPIALSERRRAAIAKAYDGELYECPVTVENEKDMQKAVADVKAAGLLDDLRVEHHHVCSLVIKRDDALVHADHVRRHADTAVLVRFERFQKVVRDLDIVRRSLLGLLR